MERDFTDFTVLQRFHIAMVAVGTDRIHAHQFPCHLEAGNLLLAARIELVSLEVTEANRVQALERIVHPIQTFPTRHSLAASDDVIESAHVVIIQAHWQAQLMHAAIDATGLDRLGAGCSSSSI